MVLRCTVRTATNLDLSTPPIAMESATKLAVSVANALPPEAHPVRPPSPTRGAR